MDYRKIVKQLREKMLLSQEEMAKKLGVSFATVNTLVVESSVKATLAAFSVPFK